MGFYFWGTIFFLIAITALLVILALLHPAPAPSDMARPRPVSITQEQLSQIEGRARQAGQAAVDSELDGALDRIFTPVHASISAYADFHYSVWGQYAELLAAGAATIGIEEEVGSIMRKHLFDGFEDRHTEQMASLHDAYLAATKNQFAAESERLAKDGNQPLPQAVQQMLADTQKRMTVTVPTAVAGIAAGKAAMTAVIKPVAKKIIASTATKAAAKGLTKAGGIGGTAVAGAGLGSFLGPVGTVVGGAGGAVVGWLVVDYTVVKLDEYFNRDTFEAELRDAIKAEQDNLREQIRAAYSLPRQ